jgi:hypothetical protein
MDKVVEKCESEYSLSPKTYLSYKEGIRRFEINITKVTEKESRFHIEGICILTAFHGNHTHSEDIFNPPDRTDFRISAGPFYTGMSSGDKYTSLPKISGFERARIYDILKSYLSALEKKKTIFFWTDEEEKEQG